MLMSRFLIHSTIKDGTRISGYKLKDSNGNFVLKEKQEVEKLALNGYIDNATARLDPNTGVITMKGKGCKLRELPVLKLNDRQTRVTYKVIAIYSQNRRTVGYQVISSCGVVERWDVNKAVDKARNGLIIGVGVQKFGDQYRLRGKNGFSLENIPIYKIPINR